MHTVENQKVKFRIAKLRSGSHNCLQSQILE